MREFTAVEMNATFERAEAVGNPNMNGLAYDLFRIARYLREAHGEEAEKARYNYDRCSDAEAKAHERRGIVIQLCARIRDHFAKPTKKGEKALTELAASLVGELTR